MTEQIECIVCGARISSTSAESCEKCGSKIRPACTTGLLTIIEPRPDSANAQPSRNVAQIKNVDGYEILSLLGKGGMGSVFLAYEPLLNRKVALKLLSGGTETSRSAAAARFLNEAMLT